MAARTIVTSHPDVACDVCGRRLLRGEQPDVFLGGGQRRIVCELCTKRATHEGWRRETEAHPGRPRADRSQRGRSLLRKLRQLREPVQPVPADPRSVNIRSVDGAAIGDPTENGSESAAAGATEWTGIDAEWAAVDEEWGTPEEVGGAVEPPGADQTGANVERALAVFNAGEYPRRLAGVARSLGTPTVRASEVESAKVAIVVAWELCWYRYEIDSEDETRGAWLAAEGMELEELAEEDRVANAMADERGELSLLVP
jgi:hypothetical protein